MDFNQYTITQIQDKDKTLLQPLSIINAPSKYMLVDSRSYNTFKLVTLGGYPKVKVAAAMEKAISQGKIEHACYWAFQLLSSGAPITLWDRLLGYVYKNVNIANAKLPRWLYDKTITWQRAVIRKEFSGHNVIHTRNIQQIRNVITEVIVCLCQSRKRKLDILSVKIKEGDFVISNFTDRCTSRHNMIIGALLGENDPSEIRLATNEFAVALMAKNMQSALYWLHWILYWEKINIKRFKTFLIQARAIEGIPQTDTRDVIWLLWSIIHQVRKKHLEELSVQNRPPSETGGLERQLDALWQMYIYKWKSGFKAKRLPLLIWSMQYLIYPVDWMGDVISRMDLLVKAVSNVNLMFEKIRAQCNGGEGTPTHQSGPSLLDKLNGGGPSIIPNNTIITNNVKMPEKIEEAILDARAKIKSTAEKAATNKSGNKPGMLSGDSAAKLDIMAKLDRYLY